jgi:hypothetical protein
LVIVYNNESLPSIWFGQKHGSSHCVCHCRLSHPLRNREDANGFEQVV